MHFTLYVARGTSASCLLRLSSAMESCLSSVSALTKYSCLSRADSLGEGKQMRCFILDVARWTALSRSLRSTRLVPLFESEHLVLRKTLYFYVIESTLLVCAMKACGDTVPAPTRCGLLWGDHWCKWPDRKIKSPKRGEGCHRKHVLLQCIKGATSLLLPCKHAVLLRRRRTPTMHAW